MRSSKYISTDTGVPLIPVQETEVGRMPSKPVGEMTCPVCGKVFHCYYVDTWAYARVWYGKQYVMCSWSCFREKEKEMEGRKKKRGRKKIV